MEEKQTEELVDSGLNRQQKVGLVLLLTFAVLAIALGVINLRNTMYAPFALSGAIPPNISETAGDVNALRMRDTDHEGLNDYDELYVYETSPYIADTDSDGLTDFEEVNGGTNPLCGEGSECNNLIDSSTAIQRGLSSSTFEFEGFNPETSDLSDLSSSQDMTTELLNQLNDVNKVRQLLIDAGMDEEVLKNVSDEVILEAMQNSLPLNLNSSLEESVVN